MIPQTYTGLINSANTSENGVGERPVDCAMGSLVDSGSFYENYHDTIMQCLGRVRRWRVPPNWSKPQWMEELQSQAQAELVMTLHTTAATPRLTSRILNSVLKRYRQEWSFARHCCYSMGFDPAAPVYDSEDLDIAPALCSLYVALAQLSDPDNALIQSLYWQHRTESQVAADLGISQQAVNNRRRRILNRLAAMLQGEK